MGGGRYSGSNAGEGEFALQLTDGWIDEVKETFSSNAHFWEQIFRRGIFRRQMSGEGERACVGWTDGRITVWRRRFDNCLAACAADAADPSLDRSAADQSLVDIFILHIIDHRQHRRRLTRAAFVYIRRRWTPVRVPRPEPTQSNPTRRQNWF